MSTKIYNGYKFDKDYSLRELDFKLMKLKNRIQAEATKTFFEQVLNEWMYIYDCYSFFGPEIAIKRMNKYSKKEPTSLDWSHILYEIIFFVEKQIRESKISYRRDFNYDYQCDIHILPIKDKLLFLYYGEKDNFRKILNEQNFIMEYHYQNQTDKPEKISNEEWEQRKKDWEEAIIDYIPSNHGFTFNLVNSDNFPFINSETAKEFNPTIRTFEERAKEIAYDIEYPCEKFTMSILCSPEYKKFLSDHTKKVKEKLKTFNSWEDIFNFIYQK